MKCLVIVAMVFLLASDASAGLFNRMRARRCGAHVFHRQASSSSGFTGGCSNGSCLVR